MPSERQPPLADRSSATPLALGLTAVLVLYASLYPFEGWRWPPGQRWRRCWCCPGRPGTTRFDISLNFAGYLPLGAAGAMAGCAGPARLPVA
jgi:VanZ family protein